MRKGFTLIEMLVILVVVPLVMISISRVFAVFIQDVPRETRVVQENTTVLNMLRQLCRDMDRAIVLPQQLDGKRADDDVLLIEQPDGLVSYRYEPGQVVRTSLSGPAPADRDTRRIWRVPDAVITWRPWLWDGRPYAVEVHSHIEVQVLDRRRAKLANVHVFFLDAFGKGQSR